MMSVDFPCRCGHLRPDHRLDFNAGIQGCKVYIKNKNGSGYAWCGCYNYTPDNLKYLEELSKKK
jgi:hypothetical protein